jgi:hypothetical protein
LSVSNGRGALIAFLTALEIFRSRAGSLFDGLVAGSRMSSSQTVSGADHAAGNNP